jgi:hypothetical protein
MKAFLLNMERNKIYKWADCFSFSLNMDMIQGHLNERKEFYRLSSSQFPNDSEQLVMTQRAIDIYNFTTHYSSSSASNVFIVSGECYIKNVMSHLSQSINGFLLKEGDFFKFEAGHYRFEVNKQCAKISLRLFVEMPPVLEAVKKTI